MVQTGKTIFITLAFASLLLVPFRSSAAPKVTATVDRNEAELGDQIRLEVTVSSDSSITLGEPTLPSFEGFRLLRQSSTRESRSVFTGGKFQFLQSQHYNYILQATQTGNLKIPPVEVVVNNVAMKSNPISVKVTDSGPGQKKIAKNPPPTDEDSDDDSGLPPDAEDLFSQLLKRHGIGSPNELQEKINPDEAFFIKLEADKHEAYVGEQITATWYLYTRNQIQNIDTLKYPNLRDFVKEDIEIATRLNFQQEVINGIAYRKAPLVSYALFPMKEGTALIDSYKAKCTVLIGGLGLFNMGNSYTFSKASGEIKVKVKPIPTSGRPNNFSGGVGRFSLQALVDAKSFPANQPFPLKIRLQGSGNVKSIDLPSLDLPKSLEIYSQRDESKFNKDGTSYKEFELLLIPRQEGKIIIPQITMSFFNPKTGSFYAESSKPLEINVTPGKPGSGAPSVPLAENAEQLKLNEMPGLALEWENSRSYSAAFPIALWSSLFFASFLFLFYRAKKELGIGEKKRTLTQRALARIKKAQTFVDQGNFRAAGTEIMNTVYLVLGELGGEKGGTGLSIDKLFIKLPPSLRREMEGPLHSAVVDFETLSFAPDHAIGDLKDPSVIKPKIKTIEKLILKIISLGTSESVEKARNPNP